jgi:putative FmdB family regulatory protein
MAVYEYLCNTCGIFEQTRPFTESDQTSTCPNCGVECERILSVSSFHLKGDGWFKGEPKKTDGKKKDN